MATPLKVLVTGATGRTGSLVLQKLQALPEKFIAKGFGRSPEKATEIFGNTDNFYFGSILNPTDLEVAITLPAMTIYQVKGKWLEVA
ncbi:hypothetical protein Lepto7376_0448 [[Leptolyngbya] sp. PCC 7376]|uniref:hypothetical protein n=1 Tax=[Leptolyngbya] sp. PCC 7376 TaxID=111781 RepID=UPI00029F4A08|nr:hypothetical protein [[Leptolyngbya] sp. PCC 7376]AFY36883.1 hypothetical protein Lepto7376_0448 [[Leptolyngbya] sp. PCC 7376]